MSPHPCVKVFVLLSTQGDVQRFSLSHWQTYSASSVTPTRSSKVMRNQYDKVWLSVSLRVRSTLAVQVTFAGTHKLSRMHFLVKWARDQPQPFARSHSLLVTRCVPNTSLVDPASSHMLVSKIKPCMSKSKLCSHGETADGSLNQSWSKWASANPTWITVVIPELIHATYIPKAMVVLACLALSLL